MNEESQWNNSRNQSQGSNYPARKPMGQKYGDANQGTYSPSSNYNYSQNGHGRNQGQNYQQPIRRRSDRFKKDFPNNNEKLLRQNDIIIRLLKEIRDRLPEPVQKVSDDAVKNSTPENYSEQDQAPDDSQPAVNAEVAVAQDPEETQGNRERINDQTAVQNSE
jgi:hypothetical protein